MVVDDSAVGRIGTLTVGTRGARGPGEVRVEIRGGSEVYLASSAEPLPPGACVLVVSASGARAVDVVPWVPIPPSGPSQELSG